MPNYRKPRRMRETRKEKVLNENKEKKLDLIEGKVSTDLETNIKLTKKILGEKTGDLVVRRFHIGANKNYPAAVIFIDGLAGKDIIDDFILKANMIENRGPKMDPNEPVTKEDLFKIVKKYSLTINEIGEAEEMRKIIRHILSGDTAIFIDGSEKAFGANTKGWEHRGVEPPRSERVIRGPREGFTETLRVNTALIRTRLKDPDLRIHHFASGERTNTNIAIAYIEGVCEDYLLKEVERRIESIEVDGIIGSGYVEQLIEDSHWSPFPTIQYTERSDKVVGNLLEGRVVIIVDGSPFALIAPSVLSQFYQSPEDYYDRFWVATFVRLIRLISLFVALLAPSLYIAFTAFHPEMIPSELIIAIAAGRATVPFPSVVEAFIMEVSIEILREASVRLPGIIGPTIGIVGALVIGQAAVQAGLVSPLMVIIVSLTTIGSFASPSYAAATSIRLLRFPMMIMAGTFGLYGIMLFWLIIILHLCTLKSFGVPYVAPLSPSHFNDMKDVIFRAPMQWMNKRPLTVTPEDDVRQERKKSKGGGGHH
ncbi:MAG TPA: spore germination protein [Bacillales bacterium]|nr:spore germination protein [Bacillales bacterium]